MKNGFYVSLYTHIDCLSNLLDIRRRHDHGMALWQLNNNDLTLIHYWEFERITGLKQHSRSFLNKDCASQFINSLLCEYGLKIDDIIEFWGTPPFDKRTSGEFGFSNIAYHSIAHLYSSLLADTELFKKNNIIGLALDGGPDNVIDVDALDKYFYAGCVKKDNIFEIFPISSPARLWTCAKRKFKLREGSLMALASACTAEINMNEQENIILCDKNNFEKANQLFNKIVSQIESIDIKKSQNMHSPYDYRFTYEENIISAVMKEIQKYSISMIKKTIKNILDKYSVNPSQTYLALSGGYALNCPTNHFLMKEFGFMGFLGTPCVSDSGLALGIGLYEFYNKVPDIHFNLQNAYYGNSDISLNAAINKNKLDVFIDRIEDFNIEKIVDDICENPVVWFNDRAEIGPRALGNRSIIADPTSLKSKAFLNKVKQREWWRPVAPIILESHISEWFEEAYESPYMLHTFKIIHEKEGEVPAILHLDGTARVQTLKEHENLLSDVILQFYRRTGVPILCNTSLNDRGEPIINTIAQALNFALRKNITIVYINGIRVSLKFHEKYNVDKPYQRDIQYIFPYDECEKQKLLEKVNPYHISKSDLITYYSKSELQQTIDLQKEKDIQILKRYNRMLLNKIQWNHFEL